MSSWSRNRGETSSARATWLAPCGGSAHRPRGRRASSLLLFLSLGLLAAAPHATAAPAELDDLFEEPPGGHPVPSAALERILFELEYGRRLTADVLLGELVAAGPGILPPLFAALSQTENPHTAVPPGTRVLESWRQKAIAHALEGVPEAVIAARLAGGANSDVAPRAIEIALALLGRTGGAAKLPLLLALAEPPRGAQCLAREVARAFEEALGAILARDPAARGRIARGFEEIETALRASVVRAVGAAADRAALELLSELLGRDPALDIAVLSQVNRITSAVGQPYEWSFRLRVRMYLSAKDAALRREAAFASGRMEDFEAFPELLGLLQDENAGVRENAYWSLRAMSGRNLSPDPERWRAWYETELAWWTREAQSLLAALGSGDEAERVRALAALSSHRLFRHELAGELTWFLGQPDPSLVLAVCSGLTSLRSPVAVPELVELLRHEDEEVRQQACTGLRAITGRDLPAVHAAWAALGGG